jgi:2-(1,2-epoxy-1,2-dihydrophenyl)acetyl-CoA isomerase
MKMETLELEISKGIATLTLNRPDALNAINMKMTEEFAEALSHIKDRDDVRAVLVTGRGRAFCAGGDLSKFKADFERYEKTGEPSDFYETGLPRLFAGFPDPIIAAVNGPAVGAGMSIVLACDIRLASNGASFMSPFTRAGLTPEFGSSYNLPRIAGYARAAEWVLTGRSVTAEEALAAGVVNAVVEPESLMAEALKVAGSIVSMPQEATRAAKALLRRGMDSTLDDAIEREAHVFKECQKTRSHYEAVCGLMGSMKG